MSEQLTKQWHRDHRLPRGFLTGYYGLLPLTASSVLTCSQGDTALLLLLRDLV